MTQCACGTGWAQVRTCDDKWSPNVNTRRGMAQTVRSHHTKRYRLIHGMLWSCNPKRSIPNANWNKHETCLGSTKYRPCSLSAELNMAFAAQWAPSSHWDNSQTATYIVFFCVNVAEDKSTQHCKHNMETWHNVQLQCAGRYFAYLTTPGCRRRKRHNVQVHEW